MEKKKEGRGRRRSRKEEEKDSGPLPLWTSQLDRKGEKIKRVYQYTGI
jgi:hypothetical protein